MMLADAPRYVYDKKKKTLDTAEELEEFLGA